MQRSAKNSRTSVLDYRNFHIYIDIPVDEVNVLTSGELLATKKNARWKTYSLTNPTNSSPGKDVRTNDGVCGSWIGEGGGR